MIVCPLCEKVFYQAPHHRDYVSGTVGARAGQPLPDFVPEPVYPEFMPPEDEEELPAPADSTVVALPAVDNAPSAKETKPFESNESAATPPPHPAYRVTARIFHRAESLLSPVPVSPLPLPASPTYPLGYRAVMIRLSAEAPSTSHILPLPSPIVLLRTRASVAMMRAAAPSTYILASH
ncbi:hypothetical protein Tco_1023820 [Tanacetum coccineum]